MTHVNLYLYSSLKCIKAAETAHAAAGFILEFPTEKGEVTLTKTYLLDKLHKETDKMTGNESSLFILGMALSRMKATAELDIYTENRYLYNTIKNGWMEQWSANSWRSSDGKEIAYKADWMTVYLLMKPHTVSIHINEPHKYRKWLKHEVEVERRYIED